MTTIRKGKVLLTSQGLTQKIGRKLIRKALEKAELSEKKILIFYMPYFSIQDMLIQACRILGFQENNIFLAGEDTTPDLVKEMDYIYITAGNTFSILREIRNLKGNILEVIHEAVMCGTTFIGASAGAMLAGGPDCRLALDFDKNNAGITDFTSLNLLDGATVIPHYTKENLESYIVNSTEEELKRYKRIYSVADGEILIL